MNQNIFDEKDYKLRAIKMTKLHDLPQWTWGYRYCGNEFLCQRRYTTEHGAWIAGAKWLYKNLHEDIL